MTLPIALTLGFLSIAGLLRATGRLRSDLVALVLLMALGLAGLVPLGALFSGFSRSAVILIIAIYMIAAGLEATGAFRLLSRHWLRLAAGGETRAVLGVMLLAAALSLGLNTIVVVAMLLPAVMVLARQVGVPPARLLIPLSFGALLGGMATLFTTANILASAALVDQGLPAFTVLDFLPAGAPIVLAGILFMALIGRRLLPRHPRPGAEAARGPRPLSQTYGLSELVQAVYIKPGSPLADQSLVAGQWGGRLGLTVVGLARGGSIHLAPAPDEVVRAGDVVLFMGFTDAEDLAPYGLIFTEEPNWQGRLASSSVSLVEVVPAPRSAALGKTLREINFREKFDLTVLAFWREGTTLREGLADLPLRLGDAPLLQGRRERLAVLRRDPDFLVLEEDTDEAPVSRRAWLAIGLALAALILPAANILPIAEAAFSAAALMVLFGCVTIERAYRAVDWKTVFTIAAILPISLALTDTGAAAWLGQQLVGALGGAGPLAVAAALFMAAVALTQVVGGRVVAVVLAPVAIAAGPLLGADPRALAMVVAWGCSTAFLTPGAHAANRLVMGPGGYRTRDFVRVGLPLTAVVLAAILVVLPFYWGLR
ncbi:MAG: SLC13 family permease [Anaerolineales bacterium]|nr:SLC13 family permease [Anaerolineales bacterium]